MLAAEIGEWARYRAVFMLLPEECLHEQPTEDKPLIRRHLENLGVPVEEDLVRAIKFVCQCFRATRGSQPKLSVTDVFTRHRHVYDQLMDRQNGRCAFCGVLLRYGQNMELDHVLPWHLGDDPPGGGNWHFTCDSCNRGKGMHPFYSLTPAVFNWIAPSARREILPGTRFAALVRDKRCVISGKTPRETELVVVKRVVTGCWILDNVQTVSAMHRGHGPT